MDSKVEPGFLVHKTNDDIMKFSEYKNGLYLHDTTDPRMNVCMVPKTNENEQYFTKREIEKAKEAKRLYASLGQPSYRKFIKILENNFIPHCIITAEDTRCAEKIYGQDVPTLKGKTVQQVGEHITSGNINCLPISLLKEFGDIDLCVNVMFV